MCTCVYVRIHLSLRCCTLALYDIDRISPAEDHSLWSVVVYHKGAVAPLYIGIVRVGQHCSHTFGNPCFRGNTHTIRNPSSRKGTYGQNMGVLKKRPKLDYRKVVKIVKVHFHNSSSCCCCSVSTSVSQ